MISRIVGASLKLRLVVATVAAMLIIFGFTQLRKMPIDALPEFSRPYVEIQTEALGLSAEEVEAMITTPLEADMINGTPWAEEIRSVSLPGLSSLILIFERGTDVMLARQVVQERLTQIFVLPQVSTPPTMINPISSTGRCLEIGMTSDDLSLIDLSILARWTVAPRLMGLPGVANVSIWGERQRQLQVEVDPDKLRSERVSLLQVIKTAGNALWASPLSFLEASTPGTGGWIDTPNQRLGVRHILPIKTADDLARVPIEGAPGKRLSDVSTVVEDHQRLIGDGFVNDEASLLLVVEKFPWANSQEVTGEVEKALAALRHGMAGVEMDPTLFRPATFIELAVTNLGSTFLISGLIMLVALVLFLLNWRTVLIVMVTVLASVFAAGAVLYVFNVELNLMIITGLMIALLAVIDDAVVGVDRISASLRETPAEGGKGMAASIISRAVTEMRGPLFYATIVMVLTVVPLLALEGVSGAFWRPLATSYLLALLASLLVAMTVTPVLSFLLLKNGTLGGGNAGLAALLRRVGAGLLAFAIRVPRPVFAGICILALAGLISLPFMRQESLLPDLKETDLVVRMAGSPAASHPAMSRIVNLAGRELRAIPGVRNVSAHVGRAIMSDKRANINASDIWVSIDPQADYDATVSAVRQVVAGYPGLSPEVLTYRQMKIREELSGTSESLVVRVYGEDMDVIRQKAKDVQEMLRGVDGITEPAVAYPLEMPTVEIEVDIEKAHKYGLKPGDVRRAATTLVSGIVVGSLFEEQKVFDVVVWGKPDVRHSLDSVRGLLVDVPGGGQVRLEDVAHVRIAPSVAEIHRDAVARRLDVTAKVDGGDLTAIAAAIESGIAAIDFPLEYRAELLGEYAERLHAQDRIIMFAIACAIGIFLLLQALCGSWRLASIVFVVLPMTLAGGAAAIFLTTGGLVTLGSIVGFLGIFGLAVRNSILQVKEYHRRENEGEEFGAELVRRATGERAAPVLITGFTAALVFLPLALAGNVAGLEIGQPLAAVVLGGLVTSTLFAVVGMPALYLLFGKDTCPEPLGLTADEEEALRASTRQARAAQEEKSASQSN